jgi:hypothetical protein
MVGAADVSLTGELLNGRLLGSLVIRTNKALSGEISGIVGTIVGNLTKTYIFVRTNNLTGELLNGKLTGAVSTFKYASVALAGELLNGKLTGSLALLTGKSLSGSISGITGLTGALNRFTSVTRTGELLGDRLTGGTSTIRVYVRQLIGELLAGTLSGGVSLNSRITLLGATGAITGILNRFTSKTLANNSVGTLSGALTPTRIFFKSISGATGVITGALTSLRTRLDPVKHVFGTWLVATGIVKAPTTITVPDESTNVAIEVTGPTRGQTTISTAPDASSGAVKKTTITPDRR